MRLRPSTAAVFCRVIDNFGDVGVALRLSRQLAREHGLHVVLHLDDLASLARIAPGVRADAGEQRHDGVTIRPFDAVDADSAELVVEAFGCGLPGPYLDAMERASPSPVWINLEYLSAEAWVERSHGLPSPPPSRSLRRWFFFPGFAPRTGGLIREADLIAARDAHRAGVASHASVWQAAGLSALPADALTVSLFSYPNRAAHALLDHWARGASPVACIVPVGVASDAVDAIGARGDAPGVHRAGALTLCVAPFVSQPAFDARLWSCAFAFVRGEDSFVRAQWAARPFAWHIYPQAEDAHRAKLAAFLDRHVDGLAPAPAAALRGLWQAWNDETAAATVSAWDAVRAELPALARHAHRWAAMLAAQPDLASNLVRFAAGRL